jgi:periplasmic protein CpxP/Spy
MIEQFASLIIKQKTKRQKISGQCDSRVDNLAGWRGGSQNQIPGLIRNKTMNDEQAQAIRNELKRFAGDLNLSDEQRTKLHERVAFAAGRLHEYKKSHPEVTRQDIIKAIGSRRTELREGLERFLTPEQLKKWDAEVAKAKEFLGHPAA